ncbi:MAG TPA: hypothetical protein VH092_37300, partial [Urbifossiella sp.]|nr:hypothetical protein [Urbifossiella sp.]
MTPAWKSSLSRLRSLAAIRRSEPARNRRRPQPPLAVERLEDRWVPSGSNFQLKLQEAGFADQVIVDNDANDLDPTPGSIALFNSIYGDFTIRLSLVDSNSSTPPATDVAELALDVANLTITNNDPSAHHTLVISASDSDFTFPAGSPLTLSTSASSTVVTPNGPSTVTWQGFADASNAVFGQAFAGTPTVMTFAPSSALLSQGTPAPGNYLDPGFNRGAPTSPFSLTGVITADLTGGARLGDCSGVVDIFPPLTHTTSPTIVTTAGPGGAVGTTLTDTALIGGGNSPTGSITFTLTGPDGSTVVDTESVPVNGNGSYSTPTGYVATTPGTYTWHASYSGDGLNSGAVDQGGAAEQAAVTKAGPAINTVAGSTV